MKETIYLGADHAGYDATEAIKEYLQSAGHEIVDMGNDHQVPDDDYPDFGYAVAKRVTTDPNSRGIVACGNAQGICIVANKVRGIRCALCWDTTTARLARQHNDANVVSLGERVIGLETAKDIVRVFLTTNFDGGRHQIRIDKIE